MWRDMSHSRLTLGWRISKVKRHAPVATAALSLRSLRQSRSTAARSRCSRRILLCRLPGMHSALEAEGLRRRPYHRIVRCSIPQNYEVLKGYVCHQGRSLSGGPTCRKPEVRFSGIRWGSHLHRTLHRAPSSRFSASRPWRTFGPFPQVTYRTHGSHHESDWPCGDRRAAMSATTLSRLLRSGPSRPPFRVITTKLAGWSKAEETKRSKSLDADFL
jgi:hypothetical protein